MTNEKIENIVTKKLAMEEKLEELNKQAREISDEFVDELRAAMKEFKPSDMEELLKLDNDKFDDADKHAAVLAYIESHNYLAPAVLMLLLGF